MHEYRAADLPAGSVVANRLRAWIKGSPFDHRWQGTNGGRAGNDTIDGELARGAEVLRYGTGEEG